MTEHTTEQLLQKVQEEDIRFIRLQFTDRNGILKNMAVTSNQLREVLEKRCSFDGSAFDGFASLENAALYLAPDPDTFTILPWRPQQGKVARLICDVLDQNGTLYDKSPRTILKKVLNYAQSLGISAFTAPECEFFLFHTDEDGTATVTTHDRAAYLDPGPLDLGENARRDMVLTLEDMGIGIRSSYHAHASGQHELDVLPSEILQSADQIMTLKFAVRMIAKRHGLHAAFMPKPRNGIQSSGMRLQIFLKKNGDDLFSDAADPMGISREASWFIKGLLEHIRGITAIANPLVNSYKRLAPEENAPVYASWSYNNQSSLIRVTPNSTGLIGIELRSPDPSANPYLLLALCLAAGLDGIKKQVSAPEPVSENIFTMDAQKREHHNIFTLPSNLPEALQALEKDTFLCEILGMPFARQYIDSKKQEWQEYLSYVSEWELERYLYNI